MRTVVASSLADRVCVVTGASSGIGAAIARACAREGGAVVGFARRFESARVPARPRAGEIAHVQLDVTDAVQVTERFAAIERVDVLVNNAGAGVFGPAAQVDVGELRAMLDVHVVGTALCASAAVRSMRALGSGHIVNVCSTASRAAFAGCASYTAAKHGQLGYSRVLAEELRSEGIRVTALILGVVDTPLWDGRAGFDRAQMMRPDDVAEVVVDVLSRPEVAIDELVVRPPQGDLPA